MPLSGRRSSVGNYDFDTIADFREHLRKKYPNAYSMSSYSSSDTATASTPVDKPAETKPDPAKVLTIKKCDFLVAQNILKHHTEEYDICQWWKTSPKLVVRRGQHFNIELEFSKKYDPSKDDLRLVFQAGKKPLPSKGTYVEFILSDKDLPNEWGAKILSQNGNKMTITIFTPPSCYVAKWSFKMDVVLKQDTSANVYRYTHEDPIYIIFNPWCREDGVYMSNEKDVTEYVLNESGKIYAGSCKSISAKPWNFGQFETCVLDVAMYLLDSSALNWAVRGKPVNVVRKISAMVNSSDDGGVLVGNWSGNYEGGRTPLSWTGSVAILEQYWEDKRPVKFGQCWVFSGLCTTICRALGIPARSVTNFASAHDTDCSITIDVHYGPDNEPIDHLNGDSIWNFHVWNEGWFARPDLPAGFGGWQAFDATPQETSDGIYCCGPTSLRAICMGEVNQPYDTPFVFAEVNADRMYWQVDQWGDMKSIYTQKNAVGKFISTKQPGSSERLDVTDLYKPKEGSEAERVAVLRANHCGSSRPGAYDTGVTEDVVFRLVDDSENTWVGEDFNLKLFIKNTSSADRTVNGKLSVSPMNYAGVLGKRFHKTPVEMLVVKPGQEVNVAVAVKPEVYLSHLMEGCMLDVTALVKVGETGQIFTAKEDYLLKKPALALKGVPQVGKRGEEINFEVSFTNPISQTLTNCVVTVDGLASSLKFPQKNVKPNGTFHANLAITPRKKGQKELIIMFGSPELEDIHVTHPLFIKEN